MNMRVSKQVIVMRKDLGMRKGKMIAQGAHASLGAVFDIQAVIDYWNSRYKGEVNDAYIDWKSGTFTKICVYVNSEAELLDVFNKAESANLPAKLITDSGKTEFHGIPTMTCCAIGPAWSDSIDSITGDLPLL